jgi:3-isopropylmalate dehydrogenase
LLPGDGIGPEITEATILLLEGFDLELKEALIGGAAIDAENDPFPESTLQQCVANDSVLLSQFIWILLLFKTFLLNSFNLVG